ncbi:MAG: hypothetical protein ACLVO2_06280 [Clostridia bacterium]
MNRTDEIDSKVKAIYNECWKAYREYTDSNDMGQFNRRAVELKRKYAGDPFLINLLFSFAPVVNALHAEYLMQKDGRK